MKKEKTILECRKNIENFAIKHKLIFDDEGEAGFGRECVGLGNGHNWVDYNPTDDDTYKPIEEYYDKRLDKIAPENAYHKHDCLAVLGRGDDAIRQLSDWVDKLKKLNATIVDRPSGASDVISLMLRGTHIKTVKIPKISNK